MMDKINLKTIFMFCCLFNYLLLNCAQESSFTPFELKKAILMGNDKQVESLLEPGVNTKKAIFNLIFAMLSHDNKNCCLSIQEACCNLVFGNVTVSDQQAEKILNLLLQYGVDINSDSSLIFAAERNCLNAIKLLLKYGANVNMKNNADGNTPIMYFFEGSALIEEREQIFKTLIENKADIDIQNNYGLTLLIMLANESNQILNENSRWGKLYENAIFKLLLNGANMTLKSKYGYDVFNYLYPKSVALKAVKFFVNYILEAEGVDEIKGAENALLIAAYLNEPNLVNALLCKGIWFKSKKNKVYFYNLIADKPNVYAFVDQYNLEKDYLSSGL